MTYKGSTSSMSGLSTLGGSEVILNSMGMGFGCRLVTDCRCRKSNINL